MKKYIISSKGNKHTVDFPCCIEDDKTWVFVDNGYYSAQHELKVYYRPERTWDDHMGNTDCGYFCNVPLLDGTTKRVYMF